MKIVKKLLSGGGLPPFVSYEPVVVNNAASAVDGGTAASATKGKGSSDDTKGLITDKDLLTMLKDIDGLPSDMQALYRLLTIFYRTGGAASPLNTGSLSTQYLRSIQAIKNAKYNKEVFEKAYENLNKNGGLNEFAIDSTGKIIVKNAKGEIDSVSFDKLKELKDYAPMTNAELLQYRAEAPQYANANTLSAIASNGIGLEQVNKLIRANLMDLGTLSKTMEGTLSGKEAQGLQILQQLMLESKLTAGTDLEGLYKAKVVTKELVSKINSVLQYAYNMLPENAKTLLKLKTGSAENSYKMIYEMLVGTADSTNDISLEYLADKEGYKPTSSKSKKEQEVDNDATDKTNPVLNIQNGLGGDNGSFIINKGNLAEMSITGMNYRSLIGLDNKTIEDTTMANMLAKSGLQGIIDKTSISFGNQLVTPEQLNSMVYRNNGGTRVLMPCVKKGSKVIPDFSILDLYNEVILKVNAQCTETTPLQERQAIEAKELQAAGLHELIGPDGMPNMDKFLLFFVTDGYASDRDMKISDDNDMIEDVKDDKTYDYIDKILNADNEKGEKKKELDKDSWWPVDWFGLYDKVYQGSVYIPIVSNNKLQALTAFGAQVKYGTGIDKQSEYQRYLKQQNMKSTSADVL